MKKKHKKEHHEEHVDESWLIPYADLLTLLLALFIVLFSMSSIDAKKYEQMSQAFSMAFSGGTGVLQNDGITPIQMPSTPSEAQTSGNQTERQEQMRQEQEDMEELKRQLDQYIQDNNLTTQLNTLLNHSHLMITISDNTLFDSGSAEVKTVARDLAMSISSMLREYPGYEIKVSGHTDNLPIHNWQYRSNWDLSADRAINFMKVLLENAGLDPSRFSAVGFGEYRPVDTNDTLEGRAKNRRVEVSILRNFTDQTPADGASAQ
ncbi:MULTISPECIES: flagellar motor protein MotB [unclassified Paenibacillus]|uniref:flagellar motor protein MotB n=1 Tax=unclassified Paenibacillus TaxID=185978 RepID=UPI001AEAED9E|nr:chemotaxis protein MotB [Paenibacillus sp. PvP091]MBP1170267.1 chemotaxis protein MotB [Paenibacillus sp. PvR098]MBP2441295.1 chemotaxis protein MotB [Paenibacillus sp. PvP052]